MFHVILAYQNVTIGPKPTTDISTCMSCSSLRLFCKVGWLQNKGDVADVLLSMFHTFIVVTRTLTVKNWINRSTFNEVIAKMKTRAVLSPGNRAKPCKFRYVKSVRNFM